MLVERELPGSSSEYGRRSGNYAPVGTIGQPDADQVGDGVYTLSGGFWSGAAKPPRMVYLPIAIK